MELNDEVCRAFGYEMAKLFTAQIGDEELLRKARQIWMDINNNVNSYCNKKRGLINNEDRACQQIDFDNIFKRPLCLTDIDGFWEYHNKGYLGVEVKYRGKDVPHGQKIALERMARDLAVTKKAGIIVVDHEVDNPKEAIELNTCKIREVFWGHIGKWQPLKNPRLVGDFMRTYKDYLDKL